MLERGEAIGLLVILAVMLAATLVVALRTPSFTIVFAPVEVALAVWVARTTDWDQGGGLAGVGSRRRTPPPDAGEGPVALRPPRGPGRMSGGRGAG
jgi:hypothetical protein